MDFGKALYYLQNGYMVKREGWGDKAAVVYTQPARTALPDGHPYATATDSDQALLAGHFDMVLPGGVIQMGWTPAPTDLVADDWAVTENLNREPEPEREADDGG